MITLNFQKRLLQFEIKNELLENKVDRLEERLESLRVPQSDSLITTNDRQITDTVTSNGDRIDEHQLFSRSKRQARHEGAKEHKGAKEKKNNKQPGKGKRCKKDLGGYRNTRTASSDTPHFYLSGSGSRTLGKFSWTLPAGREFDGVNDHFGAETIPNTRDLEKVTIKIPGMYFIFAKILANGRDNRDSDVNPPMGISLMKITAQGSMETMDISWTTQDDRGRRYMHPNSNQRGVSRSFPSDTMTVMGIYMLNVNDKIYVQIPDDSLYDERERYFSGSQEAQFGAFLIERRIS